MRLTDKECGVLEKIASNSKMDCWFFIDSENRIRDLEEGGRILKPLDGIRMLQEGMTNYADYGLTYEEIRVFESIPGVVPQIEHWAGLERPVDYFEAEKRYSERVREKLREDFGIDNLDFQEGDLLRVNLILDIASFLCAGESEDESVAKAFKEREEEIQYIRMISHGYMIVYSKDNKDGNIPFAEFVILFRGLVGTQTADEDLAVELAKKDGVKFILGMQGVPDNYYIDTPKNREIIQAYLG